MVASSTSARTRAVRPPGRRPAPPRPDGSGGVMPREVADDGAVVGGEDPVDGRAGQLGRSDGDGRPGAAGPVEDVVDALVDQLRRLERGRRMARRQADGGSITPAGGPGV